MGVRITVVGVGVGVGVDVLVGVGVGVEVGVGVLVEVGVSVGVGVGLVNCSFFRITGKYSRLLSVAVCVPAGWVVRVAVAVGLRGVRVAVRVGSTSPPFQR